MSPLALLLILISCFTHAAWNLLGKRSRRDTAFFWLAGGAVLVVAGPVFAVLGGMRLASLHAPVWECLLATGLFQAAYFVCLIRAYGHGDASLVYPLARISPVFVVPLSGLMLGRWPRLPAVCGILVVAAGCFLLPESPPPGTAPPFWKRLLSQAGILALCAALGSAGYTVIDDIGIAAIQKSVPGVRGAFLYGYLEWASTTAYLGLYLLGAERRALAAVCTRTNWRPAVGIGLLIFVTYLLVLIGYGLSTQVAYVAALRQFSVVLGVIGGVWLLHEPGGARRVAGAGVIVVGLLVLIIGG